MRLQHLEDLLAIPGVRLVARRAQRGARRAGDQFQVGGGFLRQIDEVFIDDAAHAVARTVNMLDVAKAPRFQRHADQRLVDDGGRAASLRYKNLGGCHGVSCLFGGNDRSTGSGRAAPAS